MSDIAVMVGRLERATKTILELKRVNAEQLRRLVNQELLQLRIAELEKLTRCPGCSGAE